MRESFTSLQSLAADATQTTVADTTSNTFLKKELNAAYRWVLADLDIYKTRIAEAFATVAADQYVDYPIGLASLDAVSLTIGSILYDLVVIESQESWNRLNAISFNNSAIPKFYFPRDLDFGIWPIPQDAYTGAVVYNPVFPDMSAEDYTTGTVTVTNASATILGAGTTFTAAMVGRWIKTTNDGNWYKITAFTDTTHVTIHRTFQGTTATLAAFTIGDSPQMPGEGHEFLVSRAASNYFIKKRGDAEMAKVWDNMFWTGEPHNTIRDATVITGGYLGFKHRYYKRSSGGIIYHESRDAINPEESIWGTVLS